MGARRQRWAVVGGGILGCTLAMRLAQAGRDVVLYEAAPELGGLASAWSIGDAVWDRHYHVTLLSDRFTRSIAHELGLQDDYRWVETKTGFYAKGRLSSLSNSLDYLLLPALGPVDKARLAATILYGSRVDDWRTLEQIPVERWLRRLSGDRTFEKLWLPLLRAKLGEAYRETSAAFIWATIRRLYAARRSGMKREMFGYLRGGYRRFLEAFDDRLRKLGVEVVLGARVEQVGPSGGGIDVRVDGERRAFDRAVVTTASPIASRMCEGLSPGERARLEGVRYQGIVCASVLLDEPLAGYYLTYLTDDWVPFTAVVEMTAMVDPAELGGRHLVYLPRYAAPDDPVFEQSDEALREEFVGALERIYPRFDRSKVSAFRVSRVKRVFPVPTIDYSQHVPSKHASVPGLSFVGSAQIVNGTLNVNETVQLAERSAQELLTS